MYAVPFPPHRGNIQIVETQTAKSPCDDCTFRYFPSGKYLEDLAGTGSAYRARVWNPMILRWEYFPTAQGNDPYKNARMYEAHILAGDREGMTSATTATGSCLSDAAAALDSA